MPADAHIAPSTLSARMILRPAANDGVFVFMFHTVARGKNSRCLQVRSVMEEAPFGDALNVVACSDRLAVFSQQGACVGKTKGRKAKPAEGKEPREPKAKAAPSPKKKTQSPQVCQRVNRSVGALQKQLQMRTRSTNQSDIPKGNQHDLPKRNQPVVGLLNMPGEQPTACEAYGKA